MAQKNVSQQNIKNSEKVWRKAKKHFHFYEKKA